MQVSIENVSKSFGGQKVLDGISLKVDDNEIFGLIGPSGAGKTTLVRLIIGAISCDKGQIRVGGYRIPDLAALHEIGYMPQNDALYSDLSGRDNLIFFGGMYGLKRGELKKRVEEALGLVELKEDGGKRVADYSGGMRKRLSLAAALVHGPGLLILDEPTVGIDPLLRKKIWENFEALKARGKTIIVTTHVMDEAVKCDRLVLINDGGVIACDAVPTLLAQTRSHTIEELFLRKGESAQ